MSKKKIRHKKWIQIFNTVRMKNFFFAYKRCFHCFSFWRCLNLWIWFSRLDFYLSIYLFACTLCINKWHLLRKTVEESGEVRRGQEGSEGVRRSKCWGLNVLYSNYHFSKYYLSWIKISLLSYTVNMKNLLRPLLTKY